CVCVCVYVCVHQSPVCEWYCLRNSRKRCPLNPQPPPAALSLLAPQAPPRWTPCLHGDPHRVCLFITRLLYPRTRRSCNVGLSRPPHSRFPCVVCRCVCVCVCVCRCVRSEKREKREKKEEKNKKQK